MRFGADRPREAGHQDSAVPVVTADASVPSRLRRGQVATLAALGMALWLLFALLIRHGIPTGLFGSTAASASLFVAAFPLAWLMIRLCRRVAAFLPGQIVPGVAIASAAALPCDGVALT